MKSREELEKRVRRLKEGEEDTPSKSLIGSHLCIVLRGVDRVVDVVACCEAQLTSCFAL